MGLKESGLRGSLRNVSVGMGAIPDSAIHQYPTDEGSGTTLGDNVGSADGTISGASWDDTEGGKGGWVLDYDGDDDQTDISSAADRQLDALTLSTWVKVQTDEAGPGVVALGEFGQDEVALLNIQGDGEIRFVMQVDGSQESVTTNFNPNEWQYVVGSFDVNDNLRIYINGSLEASASHSYSRGPDVSGLGKRIGDRGGGGSEIDAKIDDTIIADEQWNDQEVSDYYSDTQSNY